MNRSLDIQSWLLLQKAVLKQSCFISSAMPPFWCEFRSLVSRFMPMLIRHRLAAGDRGSLTTSKISSEVVTEPGKTIAASSDHRGLIVNEGYR